MHAATNQPGPQHKKRGNDPVASIPTKEDWIQLYTSRILRVWFHQGGPLGLAYAYANWIRNDLAKAYDHPLTRAFIEESY